MDEEETTETSQYVVQKNGLSIDRVVNQDKIGIIQDLIKCSICLEILCKPYECDVCGSLFCEDCINDWLKIKPSCPMKCTNYKFTKAKINTKKMLNLLRLRCINYPECKFESEYWEMFEHEERCPFQKIRCPNTPCDYSGSYNDLKKHLFLSCPYLNYECGFCKSKIQRSLFDGHLEEHHKDRTFSILNCSFCGSNENLRRCICKKPICLRCLETGRNSDCIKTCYLFSNGSKTTSNVYNISKAPLPNNFEAKIHFLTVDWVRSGISFDKNIVTDQADVNCPPFDIYCILEDLVQFYTKNSGWKNCFSKGTRQLKAGDSLTITLKNGELRYALNGIDLGSVIKINMSKQREMYLFVQCRNEKSKAEIVYISEIFNS